MGLPLGNNFKSGVKPLSDKGLRENNYIVSTAEISEILSLSDRRIRQLAAENALVKVAHGKFDLPASILSYISFIVEKEKSSGDKLIKSDEEALWTRAKRQKTELELQIMKGELHRSIDVERVMNDMLGNFRARLLGFPSKTAPQLLGKTEIQAIKEALKQGIYEVMEELSDYDPQVFYEQSKDDLILDEDDEEEIEEIDKVVPMRYGRKKKKE